MKMTAEELSSARADAIAEELVAAWKTQKADELADEATADELKDFGLDADVIASARAKQIVLDEAAVHLYHRIAQFPNPSSALLSVLLRLVELGLSKDTLRSMVATLPASLSLTPSSRSPWLDYDPVTGANYNEEDRLDS